MKLKSTSLLTLFSIFMFLGTINISCDSSSKEAEEIEEQEEEQEEEEEEGNENDPSLDEDEVAITTGLDANIAGDWELTSLSYESSSITGEMESSTYIMSIVSTNNNGILVFSDVSGEFKIEGTETVFTTIQELVNFPRYRVKEAQVSLGNDDTDDTNSINVSIARITENYLKLNLTDEVGTNNVYTFKRVAKDGEGDGEGDGGDENDPSLDEDEVAITTGLDANITGNWELALLSYNSSTITGNIEYSDYVMSIVSTNSSGVLTFSDVSGEFKIEGTETVFTTIQELISFPRYRVREGGTSLGTDSTDDANPINVSIARITENYLKLSLTDQAGTNNIYTFKRVPNDGGEEEEEEGEDENDPSLDEDEVAITTGLEASITGNWELALLSYDSPSISGNIESSTYIMSIVATNNNGVLTFSDVSGEFKIKGTETVFTTIQELITFPRYRVREGIVSLGNDDTDEDNRVNVSIARITENYLKLSMSDEKGTNNIYTFKRVSQD